MLFPPPDTASLLSLLTLPQATTARTPSIPAILLIFEQVLGRFSSLHAEVHGALRGNVQDAARAYAAIKHLEETVEEIHKTLARIKNALKDEIIPAAFELDGVTNVPLAEVRVGVQHKVRASIRKGMKKEAYKFLNSIGAAALITETVNASSLASLAGEMLKDDNKELPDNLFAVEVYPTSVVTWKK